MDFEWARFLDVAKDLYSKAQEAQDPQVRECYARVAMSRAYYAAFMTFSVKVPDSYQSSNPAITKEKSHLWVLQWIKDQKLMQLYTKLSLLKKHRVRADYKPSSEFHIHMKTLPNVLRSVERILELASANPIKDQDLDLERIKI